MTYKIKKYSYEKAKELGVDIKPSSNPKKKIDVFREGKKLTSIGSVGSMDFPHYLEIDKELAGEKRTNYWKRHWKDVNNKSGAGFYAARILW